MRVGRVESQVSLRFAWDAVAATTKRGWFPPQKTSFCGKKNNLGWRCGLARVRASTRRTLRSRKEVAPTARPRVVHSSLS
jgi:hypothetical protein